MHTKIGALLLVNLMLMALPVHAEKTAGKLMVSTVVKQVLIASTTYQISNLQVNQADIKRGYVDVQDATVMEVRSNDRNGYYLAFEDMSGLFNNVAIMADGKLTSLSDGKGLLHQQAVSGMQAEKKVIGYRFFLPRDLQPGVYDFPLLVSVVAN